MANKPNIRFKGFTEDWEQRKLGDVIDDMYNGQTPSRNKSEYWNGTIKWLSSGELNRGTVYDSIETITEEGQKAANLKIVPKGTFVMAITGLEAAGTRGNCALLGFDTTLNQSCMALFSKQEMLTSEFLFQWYRKVGEEYGINYTQGTKQQSYNAELIKILPISLPSVVEQRKISSYLSHLDHLITLHQRKCDDTKKLKKYMLQKMFPKNGEKKPEIRFAGFTDDWEQRKLGDVVIDHNAGIYISKEDYGKGTNVIGVGNIYDSDIFDGEIYRLGPVNDDKFILEENDIIYGESSLVPEGIARTVCIGKNGAGSAFAWHTRRVKLDKNVVNSHVATLELNYLHDIRKYLVSVSTQTALTGMTTDGYFGATLTLPSIQEQQKISDYFKQLDHLITLHQRKCDDLKNLKKYMLQNMFV